MVAYADIVTHREALAGLLADPRVASGVLAVGVRRPFTYRFRSSRGRIVSAASPYHLVHRPNASFLGVLKVSPNDRERLAEIAGHLERVTEPGVPDSWDEELGRKTGNMRVRLATAGLEADAAEGRDELDDAGPPEPAEPVMLDASSVVLSAEQEEEARFRGAVAREDVVSLLLVGLVRSGTTLASTHVRKLFWARPLSPAAVASAAERITQYDEEKVLLDSAVKATDGFFTTFFVSPYSKYIARLAARLGLTPNLVTTISVLIGAVAAAAFATGERWGMIAGAVLVHLAFVTDCVDGQLARYTRTFSKLGAWLDSVFDRTKEYVVFAGLALGATQMGDDVWVLAAAALTLQTVRHSFDFSYAAAQHDVIGATPQAPVEEPSDVPGGSRIKRVSAAVPAADAAPQAPVAAAPAQPLSRRILGLWRSLDRLAFMPWIKRMIAFPIGERFAVIAITAALWGPRTTFTVLLAWGGVAAAYTLAGRLLRSIGR
jgi:phosphatidylglycerophosphate synthase